jgi:hypothetical protein
MPEKREITLYVDISYRREFRRLTLNFHEAFVQPKLGLLLLYRMSVTHMQAAVEINLAPERRNSMASTTLTQAVAHAMQNAGSETTVVDTNPISEQQELQNLRQIIVTWRELEAEVSTLSAQVREKNKRKKALEEMILRIMKKHNIGALDLKSGGRLLHRKQKTKGALNPKSLTGLLAGHLKSETAAAEAIKYINEHREARPRESILYEK